MTQIKIDVDGTRLEIQGHAGYAAIGQDIVCAAVSILTYTLAQNLRMLLDADEYSARIEDGCAQIYAYPRAEHAELCKDIYMVIANGYCLLAEEYGQYVTLSD